MILFSRTRLIPRSAPGDYGTFLFNVRNEDCSEYGCKYDLMMQLAFIFIGKQVIGNIQEIWMPRIKAWCSGKKSKLNKIGDSRIVEDFLKFN